MDNKEPRNCWEFNNCPEESTKTCPAYRNKMGRICWLIASRIDLEGYKKPKGQNLDFCTKSCDWFKKVSPDK